MNTQRTIPMTAISRDVIRYITQEFPAGASQKVLDAYAAKCCLPDFIQHGGKSLPVKEPFYDWYLSQKTSH